MNPGQPLSGYLNIFHPGGAPGALLMLKAYFDDSGTHEGSPVVAYGGFVGPDASWTSLEAAWRALLEQYGLAHFHLAECESATSGEFLGWPRAKRDAATHDFRQLLIDRRLFAIGCAVNLKDWDEIVTGDIRQLIGSPAVFCADMCMYEALQYKKTLEPGGRIAVIFDDTGHVATTNAIVDHAEKYKEHGLDGEILDSLCFGRWKEFLPIQAADMMAWELFRIAQDYTVAGVFPRARPHFQQLLNTGGVMGMLVARAEINRIVGVAHRFRNAAHG